MKDKKEVRYFKPEFRVKKGDDGNQISGYAAVFNTWSDDLGGFKERIIPGAFANALSKSDCRALINHDSNLILGRQSAGTLELQEDDAGLRMKVDLPDTQAARDLVISINRGDITQQSFGFIVKTDKWTENRETREVTRDIIEIEELFDVSPVTFPAYPDTTVAKRSLDAATREKNIPEPMLRERLELKLKSIEE